MLAFSRPSIDAGTVVVPDGLTLFADHRDRTIAYYLPQQLSLLALASGQPDFFLLRYHGDLASAEGGLLRFRLGFTGLPDAVRQAFASAGWHLLETAFDAGRFRLRLRTLQEGEPDQIAGWHPLATIGRELLAAAVSLDAHETMFLESLLVDHPHTVDVEMDLRYSGLVAGMPWLVSADRAALKSWLAAELPPETVRADQIAAAFLSLPLDTHLLSLRPLEIDAPAPPRDVLLTELASRSLDELFERQPQVDPLDVATYTLIPSAPTDSPTVEWDLIPPRHETRNCILSWSAETAASYADTAEKLRALFPVVADVSPFGAVEVQVVNRVPYDACFLKKCDVDLRWVGARGVRQFRTVTFDGTREVQTFRAAHPATIAFQLDYRITTTVAPPPGTTWPIVKTGDYVRAAGPLVEVNRTAIGMDFVHLEADPGVFELTAAIDVALFRSNDDAAVPCAQLRLTAARPAAWVALPGVAPADDLFVDAKACPPETQANADRVALRRGRVQDREMRIGRSEAEVVEPTTVTIRLACDHPELLAMVSVVMESPTGGTRTLVLQPGVDATWRFYRPSIFAQPSYRYRIDYVPRTAEGGTLPMISTDWTPGADLLLLVQPTLPTNVVHG